MAKVKSTRMTWNAPADTDVVGYNVYVGDAADLAFVDKAEAGQVSPFAFDAEAFHVFGPGALADGNYQLAVSSVDDAGNESDVFQAEVWKNVPFDLTAPSAPSEGSIERF